MLTIITPALAISSASPSEGGGQAAQLGLATEDPLSNESSDQNLTIPIYYFYGNGCPHCALIEPYIDSIPGKYPQVVLCKLETYFNSTNQALFQEYNARYNVTSPEVPTVFIGDQALLGEDAIRDNLEPIIQHIIEINKVTPPPPPPPAPPQDNSSANSTAPNIDHSKDLAIATVIVASMADSINPCAISVMIFLLIFMTRLGDRKRVLQVGSAYTIAVFLVYFMAGLGMLTFLQSTSMTRYVFYAAAVLSMVLGLINIKDFFVHDKGPTLAIPESRKPMIKRYIEMASIPAAIVLGSVVSLFELPCTGGIYLAILSLLSNSMTTSQGIPYLLLYNAIFVLPLVVIMVVFFFGVTPERAESWRLKKRGWLRLVVGLVMLALGPIMLLQAF
jgi:cytochrome c biogenesis protein CcdA/glutaredoxin